MAIAVKGSLPLIRRARLRKPHLGEKIVPRPRLTARLDDSLQAPLTLVAAPAGFGKTTLLAEWLVTSSPVAAWLTVGQDDRVLARFVAHVAAAIEAIIPRATLALDALSRPYLMPASELGAAFADELRDVSHDVVLVIDDFHQAGSADVAGFLTGLLRAMPPSLHLLLATRGEPALPLARMRLLGELNEVRASDLRFTEDETRTLLTLTGQTEGDLALATMLQAATKGWIAGLRLATVSPPGATDRTRLAEAIASDQHVMDFLGEEVLAKQSPTTQDFLLRTAIVDRISAPLADALVILPPPEGSRALLASLAREHLFLELDGVDGAWFRYQPLFRGYLLQQLALRFSGTALSELHTRASAWFVRHGFLDEAIRHEILAGNVAGAAFLVEQQVHASLNREDWTTLAGWMRELPEAAIDENPTLLLAKSWIAQLSGRLAAARSIDAAVDALLAESEGDAGAADALGAGGDALILGQLLTIDRDPGAAADSVLALIDRLSVEHRFARGFAYLTYGCALQSAGNTGAAVRWLTDIFNREEERIDAGSIRAVLGLVFVHRQAGNFQACEESARFLLGLAERHDLPISAGWAHWALGWLAYEWDHLDTAVAHFRVILNDHHQMYMSCVCDGVLGLALAYQAQDRPADADNTMRRLREIILDASAMGYVPTIRAGEARLALMRYEQDRAMAWLHAQDMVTVESNTLLGFEHALITRIKVLLAEGSAACIGQARQHCAELRAVAEANHHRARLVEILALEALILDAQGQRGAALEALNQSISLGETAGFCRTYVDLGPAIAPLLTELGTRSGAVLNLARLISATRSSPANGASPNVALLTPRESDVLEALSRRLTYQEIAEELFISPNTVKTHVGSIYDKLSVGNRRQALAKALQLGWIQRS